MLNISTDCFPFSSFRSGERVWFNGEWNKIRRQTEQKRCNTALQHNIRTDTHTTNESFTCMLYVECSSHDAWCQTQSSSDISSGLTYSKPSNSDWSMLAMTRLNERNG